jgi:outer membrane protein assembly factor BamB
MMTLPLRCLVGCLLVLPLALGCGDRVPPAVEVSVIDAGTMEDLPAPEVGADDWPWWRGQHHGVAAGPAALTRWSTTENVLWKADVPGRGHASPTVVGNRVLLATADEDAKTQSVVCFDRESGKQLWLTKVHEGGFIDGVHSESTHASCTVACDGQRLFVVFPHRDAIWVTALDLEGEQLWQRNVGAYASRFGYGASPVLHGSYVIVAVDQESGGFLAALHRKTGEIRWKKRRPEADTYGTPALFHIAGKDHLVISGASRIMSYDPASGEERWTCAGTADLTVNTPVRVEDLVVAGGGYPQTETLSVDAATGEPAWRNGTKIYTASMVVHDGHVYAVTDDGVAHCWRGKDGAQQWTARVGGKLRASLVASGEHLYISSLEGKTTVFKASPSRFQRVATNQTGDEIFATLSICGGQIYLRAADSSAGPRAETLYCIGQ